MKTSAFFIKSSHCLLFVIFISALSLSCLCIPVEAANFFVTPSGSGSCDQNSPCSLQTALGSAGDNDTIYVGAGTYTGSGDNVIEITDSIQLLGGWNGTASGPIVRDPDTYLTTLDGSETRRVIHITGSGETPTLDGFTITNGNATGLTEDCAGDGGTPVGCGGGILVYYADPTLSNNTIINNVAVDDTAGNIGIGLGGGIYSRNSNITIKKNTISDNTASQSFQGNGGGIRLLFCGSNSVIENNMLTGNQATTYSVTSWGGGISLHSSDTLIHGNTIANNQASPTNSSGSGIHSWFASPTIYHNTILENQTGSAVYLGYFGGTFECNKVLGNSGTSALTLLYDYESGGTIINNIIEGTNTYTIYIHDSGETRLTAVLKHNTIVGAGASWGIYIKQYSNVYMWNNIIANHTNTGVFIEDEPTCEVLQDHNLFYGNTANGETGINPAFGDPAFRDPSSSDYHIKANSAAIDAGSNSGFTVDIDGDSRPNGWYDIGADEFYPAVNTGMLMMLLN